MYVFLVEKINRLLRLQFIPCPPNMTAPEDFIPMPDKKSPGHNVRYLNIGGVFLYGMIENDVRMLWYKDL